MKEYPTPLNKPLNTWWMTLNEPKKKIRWWIKLVTQNNLTLNNFYIFFNILYSYYIYVYI